MTEQLPIEQEYAAVLAASMNYKRRAEAAEADLQAVMTRAADLERNLELANAHAARLMAERNEARHQLEQASKQIAELEATLKDIATAPYENQPDDGNEWEKEYYLRGMHR